MTQSSWRRRGSHHSNDRARNCLFPRVRGIKIEIEIATKRLQITFSLIFNEPFVVQRGGKRRHRFPFTVQVGWCPHHLSPYHLSISGPSFSFTSIASASGSRISLRSIPSRFSTPHSHPEISLPLSAFINCRRLARLPVFDSCLSLSPSSVITRLLPAPLSPRSLRNSRCVFSC